MGCWYAKVKAQEGKPAQTPPVADFQAGKVAKQMTKRKTKRAARRAEKREGGVRPQIRLDLLHSRTWHKAQLRAGKLQRESAQIAGCTQNAIAYWRMILGLTDPRQHIRRTSRQARRTYANRVWFVRKLKQYGTSVRLSMAEDIPLATLGVWRRRHGLSLLRGKRMSLPAEIRRRLRNRSWLKRRVLQEKSGAQIALEINQYWQSRGLLVRACTQKDVAQARKRWRLPTVAEVRALKRMVLRRAFGTWLRQRKKILAALPRKRRKMLVLWYIGNKRLPASGAVVARQLHCSCANVHALRLEGLRRVHAMRKIPSRFWPITFGLHGLLVPFESPRWA